MARRILFLAKRRYMGKDVLDDRYGRLYHLPLELARSGFELRCVLSDYRGRERLPARVDADGLAWFSTPLRALPALYRSAAHHAAWADVVMASSDALQLAFAHHLARRHGKPLVCDLYDNYASFGLARVPGLGRAYRAAVAGAALVSCVGDCLNQHVRAHYAPCGRVITVNSTIVAGSFAPLARADARAALGLPAGRRLVGVCGGLDRERGIAGLYAAIERLWAAGEDFDFVVAGRIAADCPPPRDARVLNLGNLPFEHMNAFYNALDVNVMQYLDNDFGAFCFPQKLHEIIATGAVLAAARVGEMAMLFGATPALLFDPQDPASIAATVQRQLHAPVGYAARPHDWQEVVAPLAGALEEL